MDRLLAALRAKGNACRRGFVPLPCRAFQPVDSFYGPEESRMSTRPSKSLETFPNPQPGRDYTIRIKAPEFTCLCPKTGQPDFATLHLEYVPEKLCVELKSLKLFLWSFRDEGAFHERVTNEILDDLARATKPRFMRLTAEWYVRGGIYTTVVAEHRKKGWKAEPAVQLP
jgi:7-cyano-7-deazaguanine reductase